MNNYILIPNDIKTSDIPAGAKVLYGDILYLSKLKGYCHASNSYFSKEHKVHKNSIINWISCLKKNKFVTVMYGVDKKKGTLRKIYPTSKCGNKKNYDHRTINKNKTKVVI
tara:strand:+ start:2220 stop:2552 length:333 start_codon:yes stop_codon:yes gene_type:complete